MYEFLRPQRVTLDGESGTEINLGGYTAPSTTKLNKATL
jgi:hypothetical protein